MRSKNTLITNLSTYTFLHTEIYNVAFQCDATPAVWSFRLLDFLPLDGSSSGRFAPYMWTFRPWTIRRQSKKYVRLRYILVTACRVVQAVVKANRKSNGKIVIFCDHMFLVVRWTFFIHQITLRWNRWMDFHDLHVIRRVSAQGCAFWGSLCYLCPFKGSKAPKTPILGAWIGVFKPNAQNHKTCILSKRVHRFQQFFAQW